MFPLKNNMRPGAPLATLQASWLNTVANILNDVQGVGCVIQKPMGGEGLGWKIVVDPIGTGEYHFQVIDQGSGTVHVIWGTWTRNDVDVVLPVDSGQNYQTLSGVGADDYILMTLEQDSGNEDPALIPGKITLSKSTTAPAADSYGIYKILGKFTASVWTQWHTGGDIKDQVTRPDADPFYSSSHRKTLDFVPESSNPNEGELQIQDVDNVAVSSKSLPYFESDSLHPIQGVLKWAAIDSHFTATPSNKSLEVKGGSTGSGYIQVMNFDGAADQKVFAKDGTVTPPEGKWYYPVLMEGAEHLSGSGAGPVGAVNYKDAIKEFDSVTGSYPNYTFNWKKITLEHADGRLNIKDNSTSYFSFDFSHNHDAGEVAWDPDWCTYAVACVEDAGLIKSHTELDFTGSGTLGVGVSGGNTDHDDSYWHHDAPYVDNKSFKTTGNVWANVLSINDASATNTWSKVGLEVSVSAQVNITSVGDMKLTGANTDISAKTTLSGILALGHSSAWAEIRAAATSTYLSCINLHLGDLGTVSIEYASVAGVTISGWSNKGGLTGTGLSEINIEDALPGDKILVRR